jgi:hypothetical protein
VFKSPPVNTLTGGDPSAFCRLFNERYVIFTDYALAALSDGTEFPGQADFAYAPLLQGTLAAFVAVSPRELVRLVQPLARRMHASIDALTALGVTRPTIQQLSRSTQDAINRGIDPLNIESANIKTLESAVGADKLGAAGQRFMTTRGDPSTALNLGCVSPAAATSAGYTCLAS